MLHATQPKEKTYIGQVEAWEIAQERGIERLPRIGREIVTCYCKAECRPDVFIGKDKQGYYIGEF
jgi:hypothetical protein